MLPRPDDHLAVEFGIFSSAQARGAGHTPAAITRHLRSERWRLVDRGVFVATDRQPTEFDDLVLALLVGGPTAVLCRRSAARVLGWDLLAQADVPELALPDIPKRRQESPVRPRYFRRRLSASDVVVVGVLRLTTPARTAGDLAADLDPVEAVVAVDSAYRLGTLDPPSFASELRSRPRMRGRAGADRVLRLASPLSGSVRESEIRVRIVLAGLEPPVEQLEVTADGLFIARSDFAWPRLRLILEIDGFTYHFGPQAFRHDHDRQRALEDEGWRVLRFTGDDVVERPDVILQSLRRAGVCEIPTRKRR